MVWKAIVNVRMNTSNPKIAQELRSQRVQYGQEFSAWTSVSAFHTATNSFLTGQKRKTVNFWALMAYPLFPVFETYGIYPAHAHQRVWTLWKIFFWEPSTARSHYLGSQTIYAKEVHRLMNLINVLNNKQKTKQNKFNLKQCNRI